ncbi:MAG: thiamine diphosphokinase [Clostridia bacterium]|nr:thiamine diphosphokinase [Clostridia bacterium]
MRAFIYTGGEVFPENITEHPKGDDICIAADSGFHNAKKCGDRVDILVGDLDSIGSYKLDKKTELLQVPAEKDVTDTQLAVETAIERGARELVIIGGFGGRADHMLSNLAILEDLSARGIYAVMLDGQNRARFLRSTSTLIPRSGYQYVSILAVDPVVKGVSVEGCKYPLKKARLTRNFQYAVSNEVVGNCALISVRKGAIYVIESK